MRIHSLVLSGGLALLAACGSSVPSVDQAKKDFDSPSGSTSDQQALIAVSGKQQASAAALDVAVGGGSILGSAGQALTADGKAHPFRQLHWSKLLAPQLRSWIAEATGRADFDLGANALSGCMGAFAGAKGNVGPNGGSASFSVDLGSCGSDLTGKLSVNYQYSKDSQTKFSIKIDESFDRVCEAGGEHRCVSGTYHQEATFDLSSLASSFNVNSNGNGNARGNGNASASADLNTIAVWAFDTTWTDAAGKARKASVKGGVRLSANSESGASYEQLVYVNNSSGAEVSYVLTASTDGHGNASLTIKGKDGMLTCSVMESGAGSCTGSGTLTWSADDFNAEADASFDKK